MESETSSNIDTVEFTIRSAFQTFDDHKVKCSLEWTVFDMKKHLEETCPSNPKATKQKLIFLGKCLNDSQTLRDILMSHQRQLSENYTSTSLTDQSNDDSLDLETPKIIHLVVPIEKQTNDNRNIDENGENETQNRRDDQTQNTNVTEEANSTTNEPSLSSEGIPNIPGLVTPIITNYDPSNPYHIYYQTYLTQLIQYQHYYANSLRQELGLRESTPMPSFPTMNISFQTNIQQPNNINNGGFDNGNNNNQGNNVRYNDIVRNFNGLRVGFMGILLSVLRFSALTLLMMNYVTFDRLSIVIGIITVMWILKIYRDRGQIVVNNNNDENERNLNVNQQQQPNENSNRDGIEGSEDDREPLLQPENNNREDVFENERNEEEQRNDLQPEEIVRNENILITAWNTSLNLITSFIYSIIPENAGNVNQ